MTDQRNCVLIGAPVDTGKRRQGCRMGPDAYRVAGLGETLQELGLRVEDRGDVAMGAVEPASSKNKDVFALGETIAWTKHCLRRQRMPWWRGSRSLWGAIIPCRLALLQEWRVTPNRKRGLCMFYGWMRTAIIIHR